MLRRIGLGIAAVLVLAAAGLRIFGEDLTPSVLNPPQENRAAPAGAPVEHLSIASGTRHLDAQYVAAEPACARRAAVLIYHGRGETIDEWTEAQMLLRRHCIASLVFDYTGHGRSSPHGSVRRLNEDAVSAYAAFVAKTPAVRRCTISFSMGGGPMLEAAGRFKPQPDCVVVAAAFTSLRELAVSDGAPAWLMALTPDSWNNRENIAKLRLPVLIVHSRADRANPYWMGEALYAAANPPKRFAPLKGFRHNAAYQKPGDGWWKPAIDFILG